MAVTSHDSLQARSPADDVSRWACVEALLPTIATIVVTLRLGLRFKFGIVLRYDDWTIIAALCFLWANWALWVHICTYTLRMATPSALSTFLSLAFVLMFLYIVGVLIVKISILLFFLRAFGVTSKARLSLFTLLGLNVAFAILRLGGIFTCSSVEHYWTPPACAREATWHMYFIINESLGLVAEVMILLFPIPFIWKLHHFHWTQKLVISGVFAIGSGACAAFAIRIYLTHLVYATEAMSWDFILRCWNQLALVALLEQALGIVSISLAAIRAPCSTLLKSWVKQPMQKNESLRNASLPDAQEKFEDHMSLDGGRFEYSTPCDLIDIKLAKSSTSRDSPC